MSEISIEKMVSEDETENGKCTRRMVRYFEAIHNYIILQCEGREKDEEDDGSLLNTNNNTNGKM